MSQHVSRTVIIAQTRSQPQSRWLHWSPRDFPCPTEPDKAPALTHTGGNKSQTPRVIAYEKCRRRWGKFHALRGQSARQDCKKHTTRLARQIFQEGALRHARTNPMHGATLTDVQHHRRLWHVPHPLEPNAAQGINTKAAEAGPPVSHLPKHRTIVAQER